MNKTKVSVIVPVYNCEQYLVRCLSSLVNQTMDPEELEIICINDGSTDGSLSILRDYERNHKNIRVYDQDDCGQAYTVNRGIQMANGKYVAECDSDDFVSPNMYEELYDIAIANKSDVVKCDFHEFGPSDGDFKRTREQIDSKFKEIAWTFRELDKTRQNILIGRIPSIFAGIYRRDFLLDNNLLYREHVHFEDCSLSKKIAMMAKNFIFHDEALYWYRVDRPGSGTSTIKNRYDICNQYDELVRFSDKYNLDAADCINSIRFYDYMWMASRITDEEERKKFFQRASNDFYANPTEAQYFNSIEDWNTYKIIRMYHDEERS